MTGDLHENQEQILTLLEQYRRVKPEDVVAEVDGIDYKQLAHHHISTLVEKGYLTKTRRGLYELADTPDVDPEGLDFS